LYQCVAPVTDHQIGFMALPLAGKHCAIVGATGIIGTSLAKAFAGHGAVLTLLSRSVLEAKPSFEKELRKPPTSTADKLPSGHRYIKLDVCKPDNVAAVFRGQENKVGRTIDLR
jgi:3-oxoacyl-[acyl-carrier protein] reductase